MSKQFKIWMAVIMLGFAYIAYSHTLSTVVSRLELTHPDLGYDGGAGLHTVVRNGWTKIGDNMNSRLLTYVAGGGLADAASIDLDHNFYADFADMSFVLYEYNDGTGELVSKLTSGFTIVAKTGDEKRQVTVTNVAGGAGTTKIALLVVHNGGAGGGGGGDLSPFEPSIVSTDLVVETSETTVGSGDHVYWDGNTLNTVQKTFPLVGNTILGFFTVSEKIAYKAVYGRNAADTIYKYSYSSDPTEAVVLGLVEENLADETYYPIAHVTATVSSTSSALTPAILKMTTNAAETNVNHAINGITPVDYGVFQSNAFVDSTISTVGDSFATFPGGSTKFIHFDNSSNSYLLQDASVGGSSLASISSCMNQLHALVPHLTISNRWVLFGDPSGSFHDLQTLDADDSTLSPGTCNAVADQIANTGNVITVGTGNADDSIYYFLSSDGSIWATSDTTILNSGTPILTTTSAGPQGDAFILYDNGFLYIFNTNVASIETGTAYAVSGSGLVLTPSPANDIFVSLGSTTPSNIFYAPTKLQVDQVDTISSVVSTDIRHNFDVTQAAASSEPLVLKVGPNGASSKFSDLEDMAIDLQNKSGVVVALPTACSNQNISNRMNITSPGDYQVTGQAYFRTRFTVNPTNNDVYSQLSLETAPTSAVDFSYSGAIINVVRTSQAATPVNVIKYATLPISGVLRVTTASVASPLQIRLIGYNCWAGGTTSITESRQHSLSVHKILPITFPGSDD